MCTLDSKNIHNCYYISTMHHSHWHMEYTIDNLHFFVYPAHPALGPDSVIFQILCWMLADKASPQFAIFRWDGTSTKRTLYTSWRGVMWMWCDLIWIGLWDVMWLDGMGWVWYGVMWCCWWCDVMFSFVRWWCSRSFVRSWCDVIFSFVRRSFVHGCNPN